ncbi:DEKNAAC101312 [Brettanomyces naardenensis]|uniref:DEKNAAC101312 n=1 Tax=Brettanomyces naardenensis TaxID=13370 RepID=A0A448YHT8_BRENA|nr:DEKNAAC101312 [Brettanomyces naardenensis]
MEEVDSALVDNVKSFTAGGFGGICAVLTGHPFDLTKVLLQTNQYKSSVEAITGTLKNHGPLGFYKGVSSPLLGVTPMFAVSFWGYDVGKKLVEKVRSGPADAPLSIAQISAAGFFSAIPTTLIAGPFERVKVVMQVTKENVTFMDTVKKLYNEGGIRSIFKGSAATLARDGPGSACYFATYEYLKNKWSKKSLNSDEEPAMSIGAIMMAGGCAGVAMWTAVFPIDTIKSVQQSSTLKTSMIQTAKKIYTTKGFGGFFPGIGPALARSFPANAATFLGVEIARNAMNSWF